MRKDGDAPKGDFMDAISAQDIVDTVRTGLLVLEGELRVHSANRTFYRTFGVEPSAAIGKPLFDIGDGQRDIPELRRLLVRVVPRGGAVEALEVEYRGPDGRARCKAATTFTVRLPASILAEA